MIFLIDPPLRPGPSTEARMINLYHRKYFDLMKIATLVTHATDFYKPTARLRGYIKFPTQMFGSYQPGSLIFGILATVIKD